VQEGSNKVFAKIKDEVEFWTEPSNVRETDMLVKKEKLEGVKEILNQNDIKYSVMIENVGEVIYKQRLVSSLKQNPDMNWDDYQRYDVVRELQIRQVCVVFFLVFCDFNLID